MGKGGIKFTRQYQPVNFGDRPSTKTVDSRRIATIRAAEERRFEQIVKERIEERVRVSMKTPNAERCLVPEPPEVQRLP
jgi:hypothetical protein